MSVSLRVATAWADLVDALARSLVEQPPGVFETIDVVVSSRGAGRILRQQLATRLPTGICAGVSFPTLPGWINSRAEQHAMDGELAIWGSARCQLAVADALEALAARHPILSDHLAQGDSPARSQELARRTTGLFKRYVAHSPQMASAWLVGDDVDAQGRQVPDHLSWQPELFRMVTESLEVDPVETWLALTEAIACTPHALPVHVFAVPEATPYDVALLAAAGTAGPVLLWEVTSDAWPNWTTSLSPGRGGPERATPVAPRVELHGSHGPARQAEVLRDELTRRFEEDPTLEPRDVLVVCEDPVGLEPHLRLAFDPVPYEGAHPGRGLRLQVGSPGPTNFAREVVLRCLSLPESRATSTELLDLFGLPPVARRWQFDRHKEDLLDLVAAAGIRWGLDAEHRTGFGMPDITQNTWFRGIDRLLAGITLAPGADSPLALAGVATVGTSDLELTGALAEVVSRLRWFRHVSSTPATATEWAQRVQDLLSHLTRFDFEETWMPLEVSGRLADLARDLGDDGRRLTRASFTGLFADATRTPRNRPSAGNGSLHVVGVGELAHVGHKLVCLLGIGDGAGTGEPDTVDLGPAVWSSRRRRLAQLLSHARSAPNVLVVMQSKDELTGADIATPTTISWLLRELGVEGSEPIMHPPTAHEAGNFTARPSFDVQALAAARALVDRDPDDRGPVAARRRAAIGRTVAPVEAVVDAAALSTFLADPAKDFLRSAADVRLWDAPEPSEELPFVLEGLETWQTRDRLLDAFRNGLSPTQALEREHARELVPPGQVGRELLRGPLTEVEALWRAAYPNWVEPVEDHRVSLDLAGVHVDDVIRTRGGQLVQVTVSEGRRTEVAPWVEQLVLAASGKQVSVRIHRLERHYGDRFPVSITLPAPSVESARQSLDQIAEAWRQGRSRLLPVPQDLALAFVEQLQTGTLDRSRWQPHASDWRQTLWRRFTPAWPLFYSGVPWEVFDTPATSLDPDPPDGFDSAFAAWSVALYGSLPRGAS